MPTGQCGTIEYETGDGVLTVRLPGRDFVLEPSRDLVRLVFEEGAALPRNIVLDLARVRYLNSSGISVVIRLNLERRLVVAGMEPGVAEILDLAGVLQTLRRAPDPDAARAALLERGTPPPPGTPR
ncbi:MAG: STAS domain-containing protein [Planctomycetales bacterium]|nr:STAS domain-containing protein [Planctomycetales bacterium]